MNALAFLLDFNFGAHIVIDGIKILLQILNVVKRNCLLSIITTFKMIMNMIPYLSSIFFSSIGHTSVHEDFILMSILIGQMDAQCNSSQNMLSTMLHNVLF
jgi:hypothetical protein